MSIFPTNAADLQLASNKTLVDFCCLDLTLLFKNNAKCK